MSFFAELKRRNVFRVGLAYSVACWLFLQGIDFALDVMDAPKWIIQVLVLLTAVGLPAVLIFAWVFEMTPEGLKRESQIQREKSVTAHTASKLNKLTIVLLVAAILVVVIDRFVPEKDTGNETETDNTISMTNEPAVTEEPASEMPSLAVLPFANMSSDPDNEYFSDGISEELLNLLVQVDGLRVPSRTSSFAFKGKSMDIKEIARQLSVGHVLEGSVRKSGNQVRITAQLIDVSTDTHLWSNTYDRELENIFAIQDEIAGEIVRELKIALDTTGLVSRDESRPTSNMQAYQDYLRGRYLFIQRGALGLKASLAAFQSAVALDPEFTEAWAGMSMTAATLGGWDLENAKKTDQIALDTGNHALQLDPNSATALAGLGMVYSNQGHWQRSLELLQRASELSKDSTPTYFYGSVLLSAGYISEAQQALLQAERMDPIYPQLQAFLGLSAMAGGDLASARIHFQRAVDGGNSNGVSGMFWLELEAGNPEKAIAYLEEFVALIETAQTSGLQRQSLEAITAAIRDPALLQNGIEAALDEGNIIALNYFGADRKIAHLLDSDLASGTTINNSLRLAFRLWAPSFAGLRQLPEYKQFLQDFGLVDLWKARGWPDLCKPIGEDDFECE